MKRIAHALRHRCGIGVSGPGKDVVVTISSGQIIVPSFFYGVICAGGVYSAATSSCTAAELARQVQQGQSNLIACSRDVKDVAVSAAKQCGISLDRVLVIESAPEWKITSVEGGQGCISSEELDWTRITDKEELDNSVPCLLYSSGTTGPPKGRPVRGSIAVHCL